MPLTGDGLASSTRFLAGEMVDDDGGQIPGVLQVLEVL